MYLPELASSFPVQKFYKSANERVQLHNFSDFVIWPPILTPIVAEGTPYCCLLSLHRLLNVDPKTRHLGSTPDNMSRGL